jgi:hypothetical protein
MGKFTAESSPIMIKAARPTSHVKRSRRKLILDWIELIGPPAEASLINSKVAVGIQTKHGQGDKPRWPSEKSQRQLFLEPIKQRAPMTYDQRKGANTPLGRARARPTQNMRERRAVSNALGSLF